MRETPTQLGYYRAARFNPVEIDLGSAAKWAAHRAKRENLYQSLLGLPLSWLAGKEVLEVGCASGENALVMAEHGANLTLVEPNEVALPRLRALFQARGLEERLRDLRQATLDDVSLDHPYDLVVAEGFVDALRHREQAYARLCGLTAPRGVFVTTRHEPTGMLFEFAKKAVYARASRLGAAMTEDARLRVAETLFHEDFERTPHSRAFAAWWRDNLESPVVNDFLLWGFEEMQRCMAASGCRYHASCPNYAPRDGLRWYKDVPSKEERARAVLEGYFERCLSFAFARPPFRNGIPSAEGCRAAVEELRSFTASLARWCSDPKPPTPRAPWLLDMDGRLGCSYAEETRAAVAELDAVLAACDTETQAGLFDRYRSSSALRATWGSPYHYVCFLRDTDTP